MSSSVVACELRGSAAVLAPAGRINRDTILELKRRVGAAVALGHRLIVIDLNGAHLVESQALSEFCAGLRALRTDARLALVVADLRTRWVLELCAIDGLELHPTIDAAVTTSETDAAPGRPRGWRTVFARLRTVPHRPEPRMLP